MKLKLNIIKEIDVKLPPKKEFEAVILEVLKEKGMEGAFEIDIKIVDKGEIHKLNKEYRNKDKPTDVLSFPIYLSPKAPLNMQDLSAPILLGDIILCPEMAEVGILELVKHSTLHLLGFHHPGD